MMLITILGVTMLTGLRAACHDLRITADAFFDEQNLHDICVVSTMGLTSEDVETLAKLEDVEAVEGSYSEIVKVWLGEQNKSAEIKTISEKGISMPYIQEGKLPEKANEIAVTENFLQVTGKQLGDVVTLDEEESEVSGEINEPNFLITEYTITGIVIDPMNVNSQDDIMAFRSNSNTDYTFFVLPEAVESEVYSAVYLTMKNVNGVMCYSSDYEEKIKSLVDIINKEIKGNREQARYDKITGDAWEKIAEAKAEADEEFAKADKEIADAKEELAKGKQELADGREEIEKAKVELEDGKKEIAKSKMEIVDGLKQLEEGQLQLNQEKEQLQQSEIQFGQMALIPGMDISAMQQQIEVGKQEVEAAQEELDRKKQQLINGKIELEKSEKELLDSEKEVRDIEMPQWYIQDRNSLSSYANIESDASCIESVGRAFPVIFFTVAILIGLTTITRMVEEERGLIGTYKALGFSDGEIRRKYLYYAAGASVIGGILGKSNSNLVEIILFK